MKNNFSGRLFFIVLFVIVSNDCLYLYAQQQNPIKSYDGIPIVTYARGVDIVDGYPIPPEQYDTIRNSGVMYIQVENMDNGKFQSHIDGKGIFILPEQYFKEQQTIDKYITYYTEGRYSEWPTVGTDSIDGLATMKRLDTHTEEYGGYLRTKQTNGTALTHDTIVFGPQYWQDVYYRFHSDGDSIRYTVSYRLKLEELIPAEHSTADTVCILQVTAKDTYDSVHKVFTTGYPVYVIKERAVTIGELLPFNSWKIFKLLYTLENVPDSISDQPIVGHISPIWQKNIANEKNLFAAVKNIEFGIVWKSNSEILRLYMDTIRVYDDRGLEIITEPDKQQRIIDQVTTAAYKNAETGWMSVDEPFSIDQMAPIRKVSELIESVQPNRDILKHTRKRSSNIGR